MHKESKKMRICLINISEWIEGFHDYWFGMMTETFKKVLHPKTQVEVQSLRRGLKGDYAYDYDNPFFASLNDAQIADLVVEVEREDFDAVVIGCFGDSGVHAARAAVSIPVIGPGETSILYAAQFARKLGVIATNMPNQVANIEEKIAMMGLQHRFIPRGVRPDTHPFNDTWDKGMQDTQFVVEGVDERARELVADGADAIVIGCCGIGPFCSIAGFHKIDVDGRTIPIVDPVLISVKMAEMAASLRNGAGLPFTTMAIPPREDVDRVRGYFGLV
jgi:allantoin racemase